MRRESELDAMPRAVVAAAAWEKEQDDVPVSSKGDTGTGELPRCRTAWKDGGGTAKASATRLPPADGTLPPGMPNRLQTMAAVAAVRPTAERGRRRLLPLVVVRPLVMAADDDAGMFVTWPSP